jgi:hypothetical protein
MTRTSSQRQELDCAKSQEPAVSLQVSTKKQEYGHALREDEPEQQQITITNNNNKCFHLHQRTRRWSDNDTNPTSLFTTSSGANTPRIHNNNAIIRSNIDMYVNVNSAVKDNVPCVSPKTHTSLSMQTDYAIYKKLKGPYEPA